MRTSPLFLLAVLTLASYLGFEIFTGTPSSKKTFNWPAPKIVKISEYAIKNGSTAEMTYEIDFRHGEDGNYLVNLANCQMNKINGAYLTPAMKQKLRPATEAVNSFPTFVVNTSGELIRIEGIDELINTVGEVVSKHQKDGHQVDFSRLSKNDRTLEILSNALSKYWICWVEAWIDFSIDPGETVEEEYEGYVYQGSVPIKGTRKLQNLGPVPGDPTKVHLRIESIIEDPNLTKSIRDLIVEADEFNQTQSDPDLDSMPLVIVHSVIETIIDQTTLRPEWAKRSKTIRADTEDPKFAQMSRTESHEYTFSWR